MGISQKKFWKNFWENSVFICMVTKENLDNLLGGLVFEPKGIEYKIILKTNPHEFEPPFDIILYFDPERYHIEGTDYNEEYSNFIYEIEDNIDKALRYLGEDGIFSIDRVLYVPKSDDVYKRVKDKIVDAMPKVTKEFNSITGRYLPRLEDVKVVYNYNPNVLRDYIDLNFTFSGITDFETNTKYLSLFHNILGKYVNTDSFSVNVNRG